MILRLLGVVTPVILNTTALLSFVKAIRDADAQAMLIGGVFLAAAGVWQIVALLEGRAKP